MACFPFGASTEWHPALFASATEATLPVTVLIQLPSRTTKRGRPSLQTCLDTLSGRTLLPVGSRLWPTKPWQGSKGLLKPSLPFLSSYVFLESRRKNPRSSPIGSDSARVPTAEAFTELMKLLLELGRCHENKTLWTNSARCSQTTSGVGCAINSVHVHSPWSTFSAVCAEEIRAQLANPTAGSALTCHLSQLAEVGLVGSSSPFSPDGLGWGEQECERSHSN